MLLIEQDSASEIIMAEQTLLSIVEVAKLYKKSRNTISKDLKNGVLSKNNDGFIELSELLRVYGAIQNSAPVAHRAHTVEHSGADDHALRAEHAQFKLQIIQLKEQLSDAKQREQWLQQQITGLMQKKIEYQQPVRKGLLGRLLG